MSDAPGGRRQAPGDDPFERYLFAQIDAKELDFPKGMIAPADEIQAGGGLRERLARWFRPLGALALKPAVAYALLLLLAVPAYRGLNPAPPPPRPAQAPQPAPAPQPILPGIASARTLDLGAGVNRGAGGAQQELRLREADEFVVLSFLAPIREGIAYEAVITDSTGRVVASERPLDGGDSLGNFVLVCQGALFQTGEYVLTVRPVPPEGKASGERHAFRFHVRRSSN
jgi:hypothetical protein